MVRHFTADFGKAVVWPDRRLLDLLGIELPIIQAPMAGATGAAMAVAVSESGGLGSLPCALLTPGRARAEIGTIRQRSDRPFNVNFFCHSVPEPDTEREETWKSRFASYRAELGIDPSSGMPARDRAPFDDEMCDVGGGVRARGRQLPLRAPRATPARPCEGARLQGARLRDHGRRSSLAGGARVRRGDRARI